MKILIIGGTSFIGPPVVHQLCAMGQEITVLNRGITKTQLPPEVKYIRGDRHHLSDLKTELQQLAPDVVLDTIAYTESDAQMLMNTFRGIAQRVVVISSMDVYRAYDVLLGKETEIVPVPLTEDSPLRQQLYPFRDMPERPLGAPADYDKILVERVVISDANLPGTIVRLPMVYGAGDPLHRLYPFIKRMDEHRPFIVLEESLANWRGCYGYVENLAHAIALAVTNENAKNRIYHVAEPQATSELERISKIGQLVGWEGEVIAVSKEALPADWFLPLNAQQHWIADSTRIREELGYSEIISPDQALKRTIDWQRSHPPENETLWSAPYLLDYAVEERILESINTHEK
jgi:nucleoside-diphosphate-sugar epimerase